MEPTTRQQAERLFQQLVEASAGDRRTALEAFTGPPAVRDEVQRLLDVHDETEHATLLSPTPVMDDLVGTDIDRYRILEQIGEGGFGVVYMAEQREPVRRKVALKVIKLGMDTRQVVARFEAERQALAMMDHANIARVLDAGATEGGRPYFVMELVRGTPITEFCDANKLSTAARLEVFYDVCAAVHHAHQKGVIHRDLKPSNILITLHDGRPVPKVIDFGIAKATNHRLTEKTLFTEHRQMIGTPQYMSPEQAEMSGLDIDSRADIYSLGVLLYELLTGTAPLPPEDLRSAGYEQMQRMIREVEPPRPSLRVSTLGQQLPTVAQSRGLEPHGLSRLISGDLDWIVMKALEKDRRRRYDSAAHFAADVRRFLDKEPVEAAPPQLLYRFRKFASRNRVAVLTTSVVLLALALGTGFSTYFALQAQERLQALEESNQIAQQQRVIAEEAAAQAEAQAAENARLLHANMIRTAQAAIENGGADLSLDLLDRTPEQQRGWEWSWLRQQANDHGRSIGRHAAPGVRALAYNPEGTLLASGGYDNTARIWRVPNDQLLHTLTGHEAVITGVSFRPDGERVATASADRTIRIWDVKTGAELQVLTGYDSWLAGVAYDPTGRWLGVCGGNSILTIYNAETHAIVHELDGYEHDVWSLAFSPDGDTLATSTGDGQVVTWDVATGQRKWQREVGNFGCWTIRYAPDGERLVVGSFDNRATVWNASDGSPLLELTGHNLPVRVAEYTPDGATIVTGGYGILRAFDATSGEPLSIRLSTQQDLHALAFHPNGERFALGGSTDDVRVWSAAAVSGPLDLIGHRELVFQTAESPGGRVLYSAGQDGTLRAWDGVSGAPVWTRYSRRGGYFSVDCSADGSRLATCNGADKLEIWDARTGQQVWSRAITAGVRNVCISPDGRFVAAGRPAASSYDDEATLALWDLERGEPLRTLTGHTRSTWGVAFNGSGTRLASAGRDGVVIVWNTDDGSIVQRLKLSQGRQPNAVVFGPDDETLYVGDLIGRVTVWNSATGTELEEFAAHNAVIGALDLTEDGKRLLTCAWHNPEVRVWNADTGDLLIEFDTRITGLSHVAFLPEENGFIAAGMEGRVRAWETKIPAGADRLRRQAAREMIARMNHEIEVGEDLEASMRIALSYRASEMYEEAKTSLEALLKQAEQQLPPEHPQMHRIFEELAWTKMTQAALAAPPKVAAASLERLVGIYGERQIELEDGVLVYTHTAYRTRHRLYPLNELQYQSCDIDGFRLEFVLDGDRASKLVGHYSDGRRDESPRSDG